MNRLVSLRILSLAVAAFALPSGCAPGGRTASPPTPSESLPIEKVSAPLAVRWVAKGANDPKPTVEVIGTDPAFFYALLIPEMTPERWRSFLTVKVVDEAQPDARARLPLLGTYRLERSVIQFSPRFPLEPGLSYRAEFDPAALHTTAQMVQKEVHSAACDLPDNPPPKGTQPITADFSLPRLAQEPTTTVTQVYPTRATLPENLLKFYLHFSAPMSRGAVYQHVRLLDASDRALDLPFLELGEELWDRNAMRLTLLFDPGRIKTGLKPREDSGPVLEAGKSYTLVIDRDWLDAAGNPLKTGFRRSFQVVAADHEPPDPHSWKVQAPSVGTRDALDITFPEPLDHALLGRVVGVTDPAGKGVPGDITLADEETRWRFRPDSPWQPGRHAVVVDRDLEDLAGNSIGRPFEVDVFQKIEQPSAQPTTTLPFSIESR